MPKRKKEEINKKIFLFGYNNKGGFEDLSIMFNRKNHSIYVLFNIKKRKRYMTLCSNKVDKLNLHTDIEIYWKEKKSILLNEKYLKPSKLYNGIYVQFDYPISLVKLNEQDMIVIHLNTAILYFPIDLHELYSEIQNTLREE